MKGSNQMEGGLNVTIERLLESSYFQFSDISPSDWAEKNRVLAKNSPFLGPFRYSRTPYTRDIIDCLSPDHPARTIVIMKGAQSGLSNGFIENGIGYLISEQPCNILFLLGHADMVKKGVEKLDVMIDESGIRHLIKSTLKRARNTKSGDTDDKKTFVGGSLIMGSANNHKLLRQDSVKVIFVDDYEAAKSKSKEAGSTRKMIEKRASAYYSQRKVCYISTPEVEPSNIKEAYLLGDQRKFHIPCPCCGEFITWEWSVELEGEGKEMAGISYKLDDDGALIPSSVCYRCQKCGDYFDDANKLELLNLGMFIPTAKPSQEGYYSFHVNGLYTTPGTEDWTKYVYDYLEANPPGGKRIESLHQAFVNLGLGNTYTPQSQELSATELMKNIRNYEINTIPEKLSEQDGNGQIVLITLGADLNGREDDARLDYEVVAYSENGSTYSITHGSIGTFIPREGNRGVDRERWTYIHGMEKSVWNELDKILGTVFETDTGRSMEIAIAGIDSGYQTVHAYQYVDHTNYNAIALKGKDMDKFIPLGKDVKTFKKSVERANLFLVESNIIKDRLSEFMTLNWDTKYSDVQPSGFMNYPTPSKGKYLFQNYFEHFEAEHKVLDKDTTFRWKKKNDVVQNHLYDCRLYADACKDILVYLTCKDFKIINGTWVDFCGLLLG